MASDNLWRHCARVGHISGGGEARSDPKHLLYEFVPQLS